MIQWIAGALGWERPEDVDETPADPNVSFPPEFAVVGKSTMPAAVLDFEEMRRKNEDAARRLAAKNEERIRKRG
jgi:hypothetical protein